MSTSDNPELGGEGLDLTDGHTRTAAGPLGILFPADPTVWSEARRLAGDKNIRVEDISTMVSQDPAIVMELLKSANALYFSGGRSPITSTTTAIMRLGYDLVIELLDKIGEREQITDDEVHHWFEEHRSRCRRTAIVSRILSEALARNLADDCQAAGLLLYVGEMLAVMHLQQEYVKLAEELSRSSINYRLAQDFKFDPEKMGLSYLRRFGIPEALVFAIDREARTRAQERAIMKPLCFAAGEMVEAFDANRWEKIAPGKNLPPKSNIRMLQIADSQYLKIYERASEYLFSARLLDEKKKLKAATVAPEPTPVENVEPLVLPDTEEDESLNSEIAQLLKGTVKPDTPAKAQAPQRTPEQPPQGTRFTPAERPKNGTDGFGLETARSSQKTKARRETEGKREMPEILSNKGKTVLNTLDGMFNEAKSSEQLLTQLLSMLVDNGPFEKSALIVISGDRTKAVVVAARGPNIGNGQTLVLDDPLSPLAQCFSKIQSFGNRQSKNSPFGSKAFALAPIDADHETPVALYADCGNDGSVSFEARRIFRTVVEALNQKLPEIPGGIPVEIGE